MSAYRPQLPDTKPIELLETDFLSPQQRITAIADILSTLAIRAIRQNHEAQDQSLN